MTEPADRTLKERVRGQTSDLTVQLRERDAAPLEAGLHAQLARARELAEGARMVIWAERAQAGLRVVVADLTLDRVLVRELPPGERSAQEEAAALVVRGALKASLAGTPLGRSERELARERAAPVEPEPLLRAPAKVERPLPTSERRLSFALGAWAAADGISTHGNYGLGLRAAYQRNRYELGVRANVGLASTTRGAPTEVRLSQHRAQLYAGYALWTRAPLRLTLAGSVGLLDYVMRVRSAPQLAGRDGRGVLATLGVGVLFSYFLSEHWGLACSAFAELYPERLSVGDRSGEAFNQFARAYRVQPLFTLELVLRL